MELLEGDLVCKFLHALKDVEESKRKEKLLNWVRRSNSRSGVFLSDVELLSIFNRCLTFFVRPFSAEFGRVFFVLLLRIL